VEQQMQVEVGLRVVLLDVELVLPAIEFPVEVAEIVAGQVLAVRGEFNGEADIRAAMQPLEEAFDRGARDELQVLQRGEELGIDQFAGRGVEAFDHFSGTTFMSRLTIVSASTPSARAWKLRTMRWRMTGTATARTSAKSTWKWPRMMARALAPRIRYWAAMG